MKVIKFGGSSLADDIQIKKVANVIVSDPERRVVVVSAPGKGINDPEKVTDMLIRVANVTLAQGVDAGRVELDKIIRRYAAIAQKLGIPQAERPLLPLLADGSEVLWLWGCGFAEGCAPDEYTHEVLTVRTEKTGEA